MNIAEILKDGPKGMELDCTIISPVFFDSVTDVSTIKCYTVDNIGGTVTYNSIYFHVDGSYLTNSNAKCVIFPKGKTTWEGFQRPFKDGDILVGEGGNPFIFKSFIDSSNGCSSYCGIDSMGNFWERSDDWTFANLLRFATAEEKQKLFDAIKSNGYKWNPETKTLEKINKFDITTLKPFDKVLVRSVNIDDWKINLFGYIQWK